MLASVPWPCPGASQPYCPTASHLKYVAPVYLIIVFVGFTVQNLGASVKASWASTGSRMGMITIGATLLLLLLIVRAGEARWKREGLDLNDTQPAD